MAKKLSVNQEVKLLRQLKNAKVIDSGSSRLVFEHPTDSTKVVKVAIGVKSFMQNNLEVKMWKTFESEHLAEIYEFGRFIIVMERAICTYDEETVECDLNEEEYKMANEVADWLAEHLGYTSDNYQVGRMEDNRFAAYDYGFDSERTSRIQCGWANEISWNAKSIRFYLEQAISLLRTKQPITQINAVTQKLWNW